MKDHVFFSENEITNPINSLLKCAVKRHIFGIVMKLRAEIFKVDNPSVQPLCTSGSLSYLAAKMEKNGENAEDIRKQSKTLKC